MLLKILKMKTKLMKHEEIGYNYALLDFQVSVLAWIFQVLIRARLFKVSLA